MNTQLWVLGITTLLFYMIGGCVDYWQSARHHGKSIPHILKNYFALFWLILYSGILPFLLVYTASGFDVILVKKFFGFFLIGTALWDIVYSLLESNRFVIAVKDYWFWGKKDYGLTKTQIVLWHLVRVFIGMSLILA